MDSEIYEKVYRKSVGLNSIDLTKEKGAFFAKS